MKIHLMTILLGVFVFAIVAMDYAEKSVCMGVPLIDLNAITLKYTENEDLTVGQFVFNDEKAAIDLESKTIYISQSEDCLNYSDFYGILQLQPTENQYKIYFEKNESIADIRNAVKENIPLQLIVIRGKEYTKWNVVVTTLPVLRLEERSSCLTRSKGEITLWAGKDPATDTYSVKNSFAEWHIRGNSTRAMDKKQFKITLKTDSGENNDVNLLGLGKDDDWILNSMCYDTTKVREKFAMDMWNEHFSSCSYNFPMSDAEYVEIIIDNEYRGLYLLQRRVDAKYLQLKKTKMFCSKGVILWLLPRFRENMR